MAAINTSSSDALYLAFRDVGLSLDLIVPATLLLGVAWTGVAMNGFVVYVTAKNSNLRGPANFLMALICLFEVVHQTGHTLFFGVVASGTNFISVLTAAIIMSPMLFGLSAVMMATFCASADRLFAVAAPHQHKRIVLEWKRNYLLAALAICTIFGAYSLRYTLVYAAQNAQNPTTGCVAELLQATNPAGLQFLVWTSALNFGCLCCYSAIWALIRCKNGVSKETNTRLLRSLVIILLVSVGGYFINLSVYCVLNFYGNAFGSPVRVWQFGFIAGLLLNAGAAANAPILYLNRRCLWCWWLRRRMYWVSKFKIFRKLRF